MKLSSSPSSLGKVALLSLLSLCAINKKSLSQNLTSSNEVTKVQTIKNQLELLKPDTLTPTKVDYTYLGTPRAPADSIVSEITITSPDNKIYNIPMTLLDSCKLSMISQSGPIGEMYANMAKNLVVMYENTYYCYSIESNGGSYNIKIAVGTYDYKNDNISEGVERWFVLGDKVLSTDPLFISMQGLFQDNQHWEDHKDRKCVPYRPSYFNLSDGN